ncbi:MAG: carboxypeptidase-like regulatory domain-containing protein [Acidobacteriaceae bacterium]
MSRLKLLPLCYLLTVFGTSLAQQPTGTIQGTVYCSDTRRPARLARVTIAPASSITASAYEYDGSNQPILSVSADLNGMFTIRDVAPGTYALLADDPGYLSSVSGRFSNVNKMSHQARLALLKAMPTVLVVANTTATVQLEIQKGGAIAGTARYDDGSPAVGLSVQVLKLTKQNTWERFEPSSFGRIYQNPGTDDRGFYRVAGLPEGKYIINLGVALQTTTLSNLLGIGGSSMEETRYHLDVYTGDVFTKDKAKPVVLTDGEDVSGADISIPLGHLHSISGRVAATSDGHGINAGTLTLTDPATDAAVENTKLSADGTFVFPFVPDGDYKLSVAGARDVIRTQVPNPPGSMPPTSTIEKTIGTYKAASVPIKISENIDDEVISLIPDQVR